MFKVILMVCFNSEFDSKKPLVSARARKMKHFVNWSRALWQRKISFFVIWTTVLFCTSFSQ